MVAAGCGCMWTACWGGSRTYTGVTLTSDSPLYFGKYRTNADGSTGGYFDG